MAFAPASRDWTTQKYDTKINTTYTQGMMLYNDGTDNVPTADASQGNILGILKESKGGNVDATTTSVSVFAPTSPACLFYGDVDSGETITADDVGKQFDFSTGGLTISTATTYDTVMLVKYISAQKGVFKLNTTFGVEN